ncbi:MAG: hypothetical protein K6G30_05110, partial [Acetatifactor sp.]|nr:hypothetical protein [Acetatifactor sp.]
VAIWKNTFCLAKRYNYQPRTFHSSNHENNCDNIHVLHPVTHVNAKTQRVQKSLLQLPRLD